jgi:hypothetical protein
MQAARRPITRAALNILIASAAIQFLFPSICNRIHVRNISAKKGLFLSISKSSPPVAALEDAQLNFPVKTETRSILLEPVPMKVRVLPGIRISQREIERTLEIPAPKIIAKLEQLAPPAPVEVTTMEQTRPQEVLAMNTHEYSEPRQPRHINFQALMNKVRGESTDSYYTDGKGKASEEKPQTISWLAPKTQTPTENQPSDGKQPNQTANPYTDSYYDISGNLEVTGAAHQPDHKLVVYHQVNGRKLESTEVESNGGFRFRTRMVNGLLIGELKTKDGQVIATGEKSLEQLQRKGQTVANVLIKLRPASLLGTNISAFNASGGDTSHQPVGGASVSTMAIGAKPTSDKGKSEIGPLMPDSSMIVRAEKKDFYGSILIAGTRQSLPIQMYPEKMVNALIDMVGAAKGFSRSEFNKYGIVWGRVNSKDGSPVQNAKVEITDGQAVGPIYFNDFYLPENKLEKTSANGMFVFLRVQKGTSVVRANQNGKIMPARIVAVEPLYVSHVDLEAAEKQRATIATFHAFTKAPVVSEVRFAGMPRTAKTNPMGLLQTAYAKNSDPLILEVEPTGDFTPIRFHTSRGSEYIDVPQIENEWFSSLRISQGPEGGTIVGFVDGQRFDVFMDVNGKPHEEIYYFNAGGEIVPVPVMGGGFVIANVPSGLRTVSIVPEGSPAIYSQVVSVDPGFVSVIAKKF